MKVDRQIRPAHGIRFSISGAYGEVARAYLQVMRNDLHEEPFGLLEDVYVEESERGGGLGTALVTEVTSAAREAGVLQIDRLKAGIGPRTVTGAPITRNVQGSEATASVW